MSSFALKIIAMITMLFDHAGNAIYQRLSWMNYIGRFAFPIFAFQVALGYKHTKNKMKYLVRLAIFSVISQFAFSFYEINVMHADGKALNVMVTLLLGLVSIFVCELKVEDLDNNKDKNKKKNSKTKEDKEYKEAVEILFNTVKVLVIGIIIWLAEYLKCDYGAYGVALVLITHILYDKNKYLYGYCAMVMTIVKYTISYSHLRMDYFIMLTICGILAIATTLLYNGKKGPGLKYLFYIMYPLQFIVISLLFLNLR